MGPHVMAFGVTKLGVVLVPYPPNSEESLLAGEIATTLSFLTKSTLLLAVV